VGLSPAAGVIAGLPGDPNPPTFVYEYQLGFCPAWWTVGKTLRGPLAFVEQPMKSARSLSNLLVAGAFVAALVSSCTIETKDDDDDQTGGKSSGTTGGTSGTTGGSSAETGGSTAMTGGSTSTSGGSAGTSGGSVSTTGGATTSGGASSGAGGEAAGAGGTGGDGGADGQGGAGGASFDDCDSCLDAKCQKELDACLADPLCVSDAGDGSGQYEQIVVCVEQIRTTRPVKRIDLRTCGTQVGTNDLWPPDGMVDTTRNLINCMATGVTNEAENDAWANSSNISNPWAAGSCAKLACTSQLP
jgi:hypothetical protein